MTVTPLRRDDKAAPGSGHAARLSVRANTHRGPTSGLAPGYVQGNLAILPKALAADFLRFCQLNPKPCPLIGTSAPGDPRVPGLGEDLDIRTDLSRYRVWRNGELVAEPEDIRDVWRDDLVSFVIGCSFSFEEALMSDGIELRHIARGCNVPMYRTSIATKEAGPFHGPMVVSMRPMTPAERHPRGADHHALSAGAWRAGAYRQAGADRHQGHHEAGLRRRRRSARRRNAGVLGLRRDAAVGDRDGEAGILHHALSRQHAGDGPEEYRVCDYVVPFLTHAR